LAGVTEAFEKKYGKFNELFDNTAKHKIQYNSNVMAREETTKQRLLRPKKNYGASDIKYLSNQMPQKVEKMEMIDATGKILEMHEDEEQ
jgi:hypothetical protein